jgi:hypothetical protein
MKSPLRTADSSPWLPHARLSPKRATVFESRMTTAKLAATTARGRRIVLMKKGELSDFWALRGFVTWNQADAMEDGERGQRNC